MRYILGVFALFLITIFAIVLVTRGRGNPPQQEHASKRPVSLSRQAKSGTSAALTTQGKLVGETERRAIRIKVTKEERRLEILTGYEEAVSQSFVFPNSDS